MVQPSTLLGVRGRFELHTEVFADVLQPVRDRRNGFGLRHRCLAVAPLLPDPSVDVGAVVELSEHYVYQPWKVLLRRLNHRLSLRKKRLLLVTLDNVPAQLKSLAQRDLLLCSRYYDSIESTSFRFAPCLSYVGI